MWNDVNSDFSGLGLRSEDVSLVLNDISNLFGWD
jgi:hypothetical protein